VVRSRCSYDFVSRVAGPVAALCAILSVAAPPSSRAGIFDFLFGPAPPDANSYREPPAPVPTGPESVRSSGSTGHTVMFCVRLCDGQHFPIEHLSNATPVETCRAMCPASKTKVFFGSEIDHAQASDGARYADLDTAFVYRARLVANCTCTGKDPLGLAHFDLSSDPTLRPGDIVSTRSGFVTFTGKRGQADAFTPIDSAAVNAELIGGAARARPSQRGRQPSAADPPPLGGVDQPEAPAQTAR